MWQDSVSHFRPFSHPKLVLWGSDKAEAASVGGDVMQVLSPIGMASFVHLVDSLLCKATIPSLSLEVRPELGSDPG